MKKNSELKSALVGLLIILVLGIALAVSIRTLGLDKIQEIIKQSGIWGPLLFIIFHIVTIQISPTGGGSLLIISSGALFGFWPAVFYSVISTIMGASLNFWIAKNYGQKIIHNLVSPKNFEKLNFLTAKINTSNPLLLVPILSSAAFNLTCYAMGLTNVKYSKFVTAVTISSCINAPLYIAIGLSIVDFNRNKLLFVLVIIAVVAFALEEIWRKRKPLKSGYVKELI